MKVNMKKGIIKTAIQGAIIGVGAILPGVSGGVLVVALKYMTAMITTILVATSIVKNASRTQRKSRR